MMLVAIDPGHGGTESGACHGGIVEAEYNMLLSRMLFNHINLARVPVKACFTRTRDDETVPLMSRGTRTHDAKADCVISIHTNAAKNSSYHGLLCFHYPGNRTGYEVGNTIMRAAPKPLHKPGWRSIAATDEPGLDDDWLQRPRNVIIPHEATCVLVEVGYCSNPVDAAALKDETTQSALVYAIVSGIWRLLQLEERNA